jgi:N-methyl-L-proline demethylase
MFGGSSVVSADSPSAFGQIDVSNDGVIPYFRELADAVHAEGFFFFPETRNPKP